MLLGLASSYSAPLHSPPPTGLPGIWECSDPEQLAPALPWCWSPVQAPLCYLEVLGWVEEPELGIFPALPKLFWGRGWRQDPSPAWQPDLELTPYSPFRSV